MEFITKLRILPGRGISRDPFSRRYLDYNSDSADGSRKVLGSGPLALKEVGVNMTKKLKIIYIAIFSAIVLLCAAFLMLPRLTVKADTSGDALEENRVNYNDDFRFANPITLEYGGEVTTAFPFAVDSTWLNNLSMSLDAPSGRNWSYVSQARFNFSLWKKTDAQNSVKIKTYSLLAYGDIVSLYEKAESNISVAKLRIIGEPEIDFYNHDPSYVFNFMKNPGGSRIYSFNGSSRFCDVFTHIGLNNEYGISESNYMFLYLKDASPADTYYVTLDYTVYRNCYYNLFGTECWDSSPKSGHIASKDGNTLQALTEEYTAQEPNGFPNRSESFSESAEEILRAYNEPVQVRIRYLTELEDTPFAVAVTETITLPGIFATAPTLEDFLTATGRTTMILNQASIYNFEYDASSNTFIARYRDSIYLSAKTSDGNSKNYFLDINKSYDEYYNGLVQDGVFSVALYRYLYNQIILRYKEVCPRIETIPEEDLYGFFGFVVIPSGSLLNELWKTMFNKQTTFSGQLNIFDYNEVLTPAAYAELLSEDYGYSWLATAWQTVTNTVGGAVGLPGNTDATFYLFYVDSFAEAELWIGENSASGVDDNSSQFGGDIGDVTSTAGDFIASVWSGIKSAFGSLGSVFSNGWVILAVVGVIAAIIIYFKFFRSKGGKSRK